MNQNQKDKLIDTIKHGAQLAEHYFSKDSTDCCVIGSLARVAVRDALLLQRVLEERNTAFVGAPNNDMEKMALAIEEKFGLTIEQMKRLQSINDSERNDVEERRWKLIEAVNQWTVE
jgi:hypothetical protein